MCVYVCVCDPMAKAVNAQQRRPRNKFKPSPHTHTQAAHLVLLPPQGKLEIALNSSFDAHLFSCVAFPLRFLVAPADCG